MAPREGCAIGRGPFVSLSNRRAFAPRNEAIEQRRKWLDRIAEHFGVLRIAQSDRPEKIRPGSSFNKAKIDAQMSERDLHFNDLRGTAAKKFYNARFTMREIAETLAWEEVERIIRRSSVAMLQLRPGFESWRPETE